MTSTALWRWSLTKMEDENEGAEPSSRITMGMLLDKVSFQSASMKSEQKNYKTEAQDGVKKTV